MKQKYNLDSKSNPKLIYAGILFLIYNIVLYAAGFSLTDSSTVESKFSPLEIFGIGLFSIILHVSFIIWSFLEARKLYKSGVAWGLFTLFLPPIALIMLGTRDISLNVDLMKVYNKCKNDYFLDTLKAKKELEKKKINEEQYQETLIELKKRHNEKLNIEMQKMEQIIENRHNIETVERISGAGQAIIVIDKCPACDTKLKESDVVCPECGLNMKN